MLYVSENGIDYSNLGIVLDHQNKDMLLFEGRVNSQYYALTRPLGECYFAGSPESEWHPGAAIHLAGSPDLLHWKPVDKAFLRARRSSSSNVIRGDTPPATSSRRLADVLSWSGKRGGRRTVLTGPCLMKKILRIFYILKMKQLYLKPVQRSLSIISHQLYIENVVFTTGIVSHEGDFILASGESDLACRMTRISKNYFTKSGN
jgi:hypothetical protein